MVHVVWGKEGVIRREGREGGREEEGEWSGGNRSFMEERERVNKTFMQGGRVAGRRKGSGLEEGRRRGRG